MPWFGSMPETERRIQELTRRRAEAQAALDEALLDEAARAERDAAAKARRDVLNAAPVRKVRGDGTAFDRSAPPATESRTGHVAQRSNFATVKSMPVPVF
jgi:hypothetical protein